MGKTNRHSGETNTNGNVGREYIHISDVGGHIKPIWDGDKRYIPTWARRGSTYICRRMIWDDRYME